MSHLLSIVLTRFKCFSQQEIALRPATVFTGLNGMGKSSVIQSLLLLRQSARANLLRPAVRGSGPSGLLLNGDLLRLGTAYEVLHESAEVDDVGIVLRDEDDAHTWQFEARGSADLLPMLTGPTNLPALALFGESFAYLGAERIGPRVLHALSASQVERADLGADGSFAVAFLDAQGARTVSSALRHQDAASFGLLSQVTAWMGEVSPGVRVNTESLSGVSAARLSFGFALGAATTRPLRPTSVGFGLSYTLPVVVALLATPPGGLVLIENPEAHLHPRGQMAMGELIARAASAGVQVLVETHSDHVLNGLRLAVKDGLISHDRVALHFFRRTEREEDGVARIRHVVDSPTLDADGRIDEWPEGFFDQYDLALGRSMISALRASSDTHVMRSIDASRARRRCGRRCAGTQNARNAAFGSGECRRHLSSRRCIATARQRRRR